MTCGQANQKKWVPSKARTNDNAIKTLHPLCNFSENFRRYRCSFIISDKVIYSMRSYRISKLLHHKLGNKKKIKLPYTVWFLQYRMYNQFRAITLNYCCSIFCAENMWKICTLNNIMWNICIYVWSMRWNIKKILTTFKAEIAAKYGAPVYSRHPPITAIFPENWKKTYLYITRAALVNWIFHLKHTRVNWNP